MNFTCPACGARSIGFLTVYLHFGVGRYNEHRFRCTSCDHPLKSYYSLTTIFMYGVLLQAGVVILSGVPHRASIAIVALNAWIVTMITVFLYPVFVAEQGQGLARGGRRFLILCAGVLALSLILRFA